MSPQLLDFERNGYTDRHLLRLAAAAGPARRHRGHDRDVRIEPGRNGSAPRRCARCADIDAARWAMLGHLKSGQAVAFRSPKRPVASCGCSRLRRASRPTSGIARSTWMCRSAHIGRSCSTRTGRPAHRVRTLRQFVSELEHTPPPLLAGYIIRGDFSRWIGDVFGDRALADELRALEERYRARSREEVIGKWQEPCAADTTWRKTNVKRSRLERPTCGTRTAAPDGRPERRSANAPLASVSGMRAPLERACTAINRWSGWPAHSADASRDACRA